MVIPCLIGYANASLWSGDIVDLMNDPIVAPPYQVDGHGKFTQFAAPLKINGEVQKDKAGNDIKMGPYPKKSWECWVVVICTIISVSITFPLVTRILTRMAETSMPKLRNNTVHEMVF